MKKRNLIYVAALGASIMFSSCNDFLDTMPDSRTEVNNEKKITDILVSAYSQTYPIMFYELSSDNTMDSGAKYIILTGSQLLNIIFGKTSAK